MSNRLPRSWRTIVIALISIGLVLLAVGGYLTPLTKIAFSPVIAAQTWLSDRYLAVQSLLNAPRMSPN